MDETRKMYVEMPLALHTYDVDYMQIVSNTVYVKWLEDMRMAILDKYFPLTEMLKDHSSPILAETYVQYRHPITFGCKPQGKCWIWLTRRGRWRAECVIEEGGKVYATAWQTGYYYNMERHRPAPFPDEMIEKYLIEE